MINFQKSYFHNFPPLIFLLFSTLCFQKSQSPDPTGGRVPTVMMGSWPKSRPCSDPRGWETWEAPLLGPHWWSNTYTEEPRAPVTRRVRLVVKFSQLNHEEHFHGTYLTLVKKIYIYIVLVQYPEVIPILQATLSGHRLTPKCKETKTNQNSGFRKDSSFGYFHSYTSPHVLHIFIFSWGLKNYAALVHGYSHFEQSHTIQTDL